MKYTPTDIKEKQDLMNMIRTFKEHKPEVAAFDTETTGLHLKVDVPFLFQFGWNYNNHTYTYAVDVERTPELAQQTILAFYKLAEKCKYLIGHNICFDLHMVENINIAYKGNNLSDTMIAIRYAHDALTPANGGPPLQLKAYASRYIDRSAKDHERLVRVERSQLAKSYNVTLLAALKGQPNPPAPYKSWTKNALEDLFKDSIATYENLPTKEMRDIAVDWFNKLPKQISQRMKNAFVSTNDIPYNMLNREKVTEYGHMDIVLTLAVWNKTIPVLITRGNEVALALESKLIWPLKRMEDTGFKIDKDYVLKAQKKVKAYIQKQRKVLYDLAGMKIKVNQNTVVIAVLREKFNIITSSTGVDVLNKLKNTCENADAKLFIDTLQELRTLDKWYTTYLMRFVNELKICDRIYTQIKQVGAVSGRVTSDFQQFPKYGIQTVDGEELFNPRAMITVTGGKYKALAYLDYSQVELRFQALYTILVGDPDPNLCRAYMPYNCYHIVDGEHIDFDYYNPKHISSSYTEQWYHKEDDAPWEQVDVHAASTAMAFPDLPRDSAEFKKMRGKVGKPLNFAKNYGAQFNKICEMFIDYHFDEETLRRIDNAYYAAFPGVKSYHAYCYSRAQESIHTTNLFGIKYYGLSGHKLINCLVQGSAAFFLKLKMIEVDELLQNYKTKYQMNIHDEMSFEIYEGEEDVVFELQKIMESYPEGLVPIIADLEISTTTWANKIECEDKEDVTRVLNGTSSDEL